MSDLPVLLRCRLASLALAAGSVLAIALCAAGCKRNSPAMDAAQPLHESFKSSDPEIKQAVQTATSSLQAGNYADAARALGPIVTGRNLTAPQKQAVGIAIQQMNQAIAANPALDTKEMYELRLKMFRAVDGGPRF